MFRNGSKIQSKIILYAMMNFALPERNYPSITSSESVKWVNSKDFHSIDKNETILQVSDYHATTSSNFMIRYIYLHSHLI